MGEIFSIGYTFNVFVKFYSYTDLGEGEKISFPVRIYNAPNLCVASVPPLVPEVWSPIVDGYDPTYIYHEQDRVSQYYKDVYLHNWRLWYEKSKVEAPEYVYRDYEVAGSRKEEKGLKDLA